MESLKAAQTDTNWAQQTADRTGLRWVQRWGCPMVAPMAGHSANHWDKQTAVPWALPMAGSMVRHSVC